MTAGVKSITPLSALPAITSPVTIEGYTQGVASANTLAVGDNAVHLIELSESFSTGRRRDKRRSKCLTRCCAKART